MGQPSRTTSIPPKNIRVPFHLWGWKKNLNVLSKPIRKPRPARNKIYKAEESNKSVSHLKYQYKIFIHWYSIVSSTWFAVLRTLLIHR